MPHSKPDGTAPDRSVPTVGLRRVLVTGGGTGIGLAVCEAILAGGGQVVAVGRRSEPLQAIAARYPGQAHALVADLAAPEQREGLLARGRALMGGLDGFVHSAGYVAHEAPGSISEAALRAQLEINLVAPLRLGEQALELLEDGGGMVFVASTLAVRPVLTSAVYSAAKAGLIEAMKVLALAGAPRGVRASAVLPGVVDTDMIRAPAPTRDGQTESPSEVERRVERLRTLHPIGRLGAPSDVAACTTYLLGAHWISGASITIDGGLLLRE
jgi:NAD(P)-dependent dehydrogenase (short-subunit alcohol dehydrogenase family)